MKKMLIIEDDPLWQGTLKRIFSDTMKINQCYSIDNYYESFENNRYDIIILDISLIGYKSGLDLTRELKVHPIHKDTPILCLTTHAFQLDEETIFASGVDLFLTKPVGIKELRKHVQGLLEQHPTFPFSIIN